MVLFLASDDAAADDRPRIFRGRGLAMNGRSARQRLRSRAPSWARVRSGSSATTRSGSSTSRGTRSIATIPRGGEEQLDRAARRSASSCPPERRRVRRRAADRAVPFRPRQRDVRAASSRSSRTSRQPAERRRGRSRRAPVVRHDGRWRESEDRRLSIASPKGGSRARGSTISRSPTARPSRPTGGCSTSPTRSGRRSSRRTIRDDGSLGGGGRSCASIRSDGYPDGPTVDTEGCLWIGLFARLGGAPLFARRRAHRTRALSRSRTSPNSLRRRDLRTAYATTARKGLTPKRSPSSPRSATCSSSASMSRESNVRSSATDAFRAARLECARRANARSAVRRSSA